MNIHFFTRAFSRAGFLVCALALCAAFRVSGAADAWGAALGLSANGNYSGGGEYAAIEVNGGSRTAISGSALTLTGPGGASGMFSPRGGTLTVNGTTLTLGAGSSAPGGTFAANVILAGNGHLAVNGISAQTSSYSLSGYSISTSANNTGTLTLSGAGSFTNVASVGSADAMLARLAMTGEMRLALRSGFYAGDVRLDRGAQITVQEGDLKLPAESSINLNDGSRIWVQKGAATVGKLRLGADIDAPIEWLTKNNVLESQGDIIVQGRLTVDHGLGSLVSHNGNITIASPQGEIETNGGQLHLEALNGKIHAPGGDLPISGDITALEVEAAAINCKNLIAMNVIAQSLNVTENAEISSYGISVKGAGVIGGNLVMSDLANASSLGTLKVGGSVSMKNAGSVSLTSLIAGSDVSIDGGSVSGGGMAGRQISLGMSGAATSVALKGLALHNSLDAGANATLRVGALTSGGTPQTGADAPASQGKTGVFAASAALSNAEVNSAGQEISIGGGSIVHSSVAATKGDVSLASGSLSASSIGAGRDIRLGGGVKFAGGDYLGAARNLASESPLSGPGLLLYAGSAMTAPEISASRIAAASLTTTGGVTASASLAAGAAKIGGDLALAGAPYAYAAFNSAAVGGSVSLRDATLSSGSLSATTVSLSGAYPTELNVVSLTPGGRLDVGANGYASLGRLDGDWLRSQTPANATHGVLGVYSPVRLASLSVGSAKAASGMSFGADSFLLVNGSAAKESDNPAGAISATAPIAADVAAGAKIAFSGDVRPNNVYVVLGNNVTTRYASLDAWNDEAVDSGNHLISLKKIPGRDGSFMATAIPSGEQYPDLDGSLGGIVDDAINRPGAGGSAGATTPGGGIPALPRPTPGAPAVPSAPGNGLPGLPAISGVPGLFPAIPAGPDQAAYPGDPAYGYGDGGIGSAPWHLNSALGGTRFLSRVTSTLYMDHDYKGAVRTLESAARMAVLGAVPQMTRAANLSAAEAALERASFSPERYGQSGMKSEDAQGRAFALWIAPLFRAVNGYDLHANNFGYDFSGNLGGIVAGADWTFGENLRAGFDLSMGGGYAQSGGDLAKTTNRMGFFGAGVYGGWLWNDFSLAFDAHYTGSWNDLRQELPASLRMDDLTGDLTAGALSASLRAERNFRISDSWNLSPNAGARWLWLHTDGYTFYSDGAVLDGEAIDQQIWTFPFGLALKGDFTTESGWKLAPRIEASAIPAAGNIEARTKLRFIGTRPEAQIYTQTMDYFTAGGGLGLEASKGAVSLSLLWSIQAGARGTAQTAFGSFCYEF